MKRVLLCCMVLIPLSITAMDVTYAEEEDKTRKGLLSGVLEKVESTVKVTTESVGEVVDSAVKGVDQTVQDAASFTKDTVEALVDPSRERPVSLIVNETMELVGKSVYNLTPIVDNTTETVHTVTSSVTGIVEELPEFPIVTPILDEVDKTVIGVEETLNEVVEVEGENVVHDFFEHALPKPVIVEKQAVSENDTTTVPRKDLTTRDEEARAEETGKTAVSLEPVTVLDEPVEDAVSTNDPFETSDLLVEDIDVNSNETSQATPVNQITIARGKVESPSAPMQEAPMLPTSSGEHADRLPLAITTSTTSVTSPVMMHSGNADVFTGVIDVNVILHKLSGRQWVHSDEQMRIQWVHAPPGQPPQSTPFFTS